MQFLLLGITETWLKQSDCFYNIDHYSFLANGREAKRGGVAIIRNDIDFKIRADLD